MFLPLSLSLLFVSRSFAQTPTSVPCLCTQYSQITPSLSVCPTLTLSSIAAPASSAIILTNLAPGTRIIFAGTTTFGYTPNSQFRPIQISGSNVVIEGAEGMVIDGGGEMYWDGLGSNGGRAKPGQFAKIQITNNSLLQNLYIQNYPSHGLNLAGVTNSIVRNITLNNFLGDAPNNISNGLSAAHNSDGFNVGNSVNLTLQDSKVWNQDDCVVVSDSRDVLVSGMFCTGSHGLSIAGGGTGPGHNISNITFQNSIVTNSTNGLRIKTDLNATGSVADILFSNITLSNIKNYGIDIQQDYLNGGSSGIPSNGVRLQGVRFVDVRGWVVRDAMDYFILCGNGSCSDVTFSGVEITGGEKGSSCNFPAGGCPGP